MARKSRRPIDVTAVITAHREGVIAGATARSALEAVRHAKTELGLALEILVVLDRTDDTTRRVLTGAFGDEASFLETDEGDPGQARNRGVDQAAGEYICFLDGDDLWSFNWITEAYKFVSQRPDVIGHSACNVIFGVERNLWWHVDSDGPLFDPQFLRWANYWDALTFTRTEVYRTYPFRANDMSIGFGHEDWHWNCLTIARGLAHKPVPNTVHFKRRRVGSVSENVNAKLGTIWPLHGHESLTS